MKCKTASKATTKTTKRVQISASSTQIKKNIISETMIHLISHEISLKRDKFAFRI